MFHMFVIQLKAPLNATYKVVDNACSFLLRIRIIIGDTDDEEPVGQRSSQMPWASKALNNLYIYLVICWNWTSLRILLERSWKTLFRNTLYLQ